MRDLWLAPVWLTHSHPLSPLAASVFGNDAQFIDALQLDRPELPLPGCLAHGYGYHDSAAAGFHQADGLPADRGTVRHGQRNAAVPAGLKRRGRQDALVGIVAA